MATLVAIGYPDETTATAASLEAHRMAKDFIIQPDAIAVIIRDKENKFHVTTSHHAVGEGATWGMFWGFLFGLLFFIPVFGMAIGAGMGALMGKLTKGAIDKQFRDQVRDMLQPGTSALFLVVEHATPDKAVEGLRSSSRSTDPANAARPAPGPGAGFGASVPHRTGSSVANDVRLDGHRPCSAYETSLDLGRDGHARDHHVPRRMRWRRR
jgi:uncharacterized membrane protein